MFCLAGDSAEDITLSITPSQHVKEGDFVTLSCVLGARYSGSIVTWKRKQGSMEYPVKADAGGGRYQMSGGSKGTGETEDRLTISGQWLVYF